MCSSFWGPTKSRRNQKIILRWFQLYSWNSEVETTWISLIGWPHRTSNVYVQIWNLIFPLVDNHNVPIELWFLCTWSIFIKITVKGDCFEIGMSWHFKFVVSNVLCMSSADSLMTKFEYWIFFYFSTNKKSSVKQPSIEKSKQIFDIQISS